MTKTKNYALNQWDGGDRILRTDFNADNAAIEAALTAQSKRIDTLNTTAENRHKARLCWITGSYTGNGVKNRVIDLGTEVSLIIVWRKNVALWGDSLGESFAIIPANGAVIGSHNGNYEVDKVLEHTGTGFKLLHESYFNFTGNNNEYGYMALTTGE